MITQLIRILSAVKLLIINKLNIKIMRTINKIITPVSTKFGAPMGRANVDTCKKETVNGQLMSYTGKLFDCAIPLDSGGYDKGGVYWGLGSQLRVTYNKDLTYIQFYRK